MKPAVITGGDQGIGRVTLAPENSFITGQNFIVDGDMTRKMIYV